MVRVVREIDHQSTAMESGRGSIINLFPPADDHPVDLHIIDLLPFADPGRTHFHSRSANILYVIHGTITVSFEDRDEVLGSGDSVLIPAGVIHSVSNLSAAPARLVELYTPAPADFVLVESA